MRLAWAKTVSLDPEQESERRLSRAGQVVQEVPERLLRLYLRVDSREKQTDSSATPRPGGRALCHELPVVLSHSSSGKSHHFLWLFAYLRRSLDEAVAGCAGFRCVGPNIFIRCVSLNSTCPRFFQRETRWARGPDRLSPGGAGRHRSNYDNEHDYLGRGLSRWRTAQS